MSPPIVWSIAGSDSGGGAGIQADLRTMHDFGVHPCTAITALTAQNSLGVTAIEYCSRKVFKAQLDALNDDLPAAVIKLGMLGNSDVIETVADFLQSYEGYVVCDPVFISTSRSRLIEKDAENFFIERILPWVDLITPNFPEAAVLAGREMHSLESMAEAAKAITERTGKAVLLKGGHGIHQRCHDYYHEAGHSYWISHDRINNHNTHGTGCTLSSAIASCIALGYPLKDAIVLARMYVHQGIRHGRQVGKGAGPVGHYGFPNDRADMPMISDSSLAEFHSAPFPCFDPKNGMYALVRNSQELEQLLPQGISTIQLRMKDQPLEAVRREIASSLKLTRKAGAQLILNDYWQLAIEYGVDGVHLGQEDLQEADFAALRKSGLKVGISTHNFHEIAIAHRYRPSYIGFGPIYETKTKSVKEPPKGEKALTEACKLSDYPVVAIGGIMPDQFGTLMQCGAAAIATTAFRA